MGKLEDGIKMRIRYCGLSIEWYTVQIHFFLNGFSLDVIIYNTVANYFLLLSQDLEINYLKYVIQFLLI